MADESQNPLIKEEPSSGAEEGDLKQRIIDELCTIFDPEIPVNIYELGLIYKVDVTPEASVAITMTLTAPSCPVAGELPGDVEKRVRAVAGVKDAKVELVWDPPWDKDMISEAAKLQMGLI